MFESEIVTAWLSEAAHLLNETGDEILTVIVESSSGARFGVHVHCLASSIDRAISDTMPPWLRDGRAASSEQQERDETASADA